MAKERLQKYLAAAGVDSRRKCEELILSGDVRVNGQVVDELPAFVDPQQDEVKVGRRTVKPAAREYYLINKPKGYLCTNSDPQGRKKAIDLVPTQQRVFCVGRLDADTTGALIVTNDSELANRLTHPRYELPKTYEVRLRGRVDGEALQKVKKGVWLSEGKTNRAAIKILKRGRDESVIQIQIRQGLNRQIRRMMASIGFKVRGLKRTHIGTIGIHKLPVGGWRKLTQSQISYLRKATRSNV